MWKNLNLKLSFIFGVEEHQRDISWAAEFEFKSESKSNLNKNILILNANLITINTEIQEYLFEGNDDREHEKGEDVEDEIVNLVILEMVLLHQPIPIFEHFGSEICRKRYPLFRAGNFLEMQENATMAKTFQFLNDHPHLQQNYTGH